MSRSRYQHQMQTNEIIITSKFMGRLCWNYVCRLALVWNCFWCFTRHFVSSLAQGHGQITKQILFPNTAETINGSAMRVEQKDSPNIALWKKKNTFKINPSKLGWDDATKGRQLSGSSCSQHNSDIIQHENIFKFSPV